MLVSPNICEFYIAFEVVIYRIISNSIYSERWGMSFQADCAILTENIVKSLPDIYIIINWVTNKEIEHFSNARILIGCSLTRNNEQY